MHYRSTYRSIVGLALQSQAEFADYNFLSAWSQTIDHEELPFFAVATPRELKELTAHQSSTRTTTLMAVFKVQGGNDLEDILDGLSIVAERTIIEALDASDRDCDMSETAVELDGGAGNRVGTLTLKFAVTTWPLEPITD